VLKTLAIVTAVAVLAGPRAHATTLVPAELADLARAARVIVRGRIAAVEARSTDDRRAIETLVTLDPETYLKGSPASVVRFRVPGGQIGRYRRVVVGAPQFAPGQRVIVFLAARSPAIPSVIGLNQGVFRLVRGADGELEVVPPPIIGAPGRRAPVVRGSASRRPMPLGMFEREVRALAGGGR
jgi:hypothetical protein